VCVLVREQVRVVRREQTSVCERAEQVVSAVHWSPCCGGSSGGGGDCSGVEGADVTEAVVGSAVAVDVVAVVVFVAVDSVNVAVVFVVAVVAMVVAVCLLWRRVAVGAGHRHGLVGLVRDHKDKPLPHR
jgi:hypothetical protein